MRGAHRERSGAARGRYGVSVQSAALVIDLDGVVREWPSHEPDLTKLTGLAPDLVRGALFESELLRRVEPPRV
jgi:hypothetical protein